MPIISQKPLVENGKTFDRLAVNVSISPVMKPTDIGPSFAIQFLHYRKNEAGEVETPEAPAPVGFGYSAMLATADQDVENTVREVMAAIAKLAETKGI
jgi:hypothetical protein